MTGALCPCGGDAEKCPGMCPEVSQVMPNWELADAIKAASLLCALHGSFSTAGQAGTKHLEALLAEQARRAAAPTIQVGGDERRHVICICPDCNRQRYDTVAMPCALTAENGAKAALMGEFKLGDLTPCRNCDDEGLVGGDVCNVCGGRTLIDNRPTVDWTTIKAIYAAAVKLFHPEVPV